MRLICFAQEIIDADIIKLSQFDENLRGDVVGTDFILRVACLRHTQVFGNLLLFQVMINAKISDTMIHHFYHPKTVYLT